MKCPRIATPPKIKCEYDSLEWPTQWCLEIQMTRFQSLFFLCFFYIQAAICPIFFALTCRQKKNCIWAQRDGNELNSFHKKKQFGRLWTIQVLGCLIKHKTNYMMCILGYIHTAWNDAQFGFLFDLIFLSTLSHYKNKLLKWIQRVRDVNTHAHKAWLRVT